MGCYHETLGLLRQLGVMDRLYSPPRLEVPFVSDKGTQRAGRDRARPAASALRAARLRRAFRGGQVFRDQAGAAASPGATAARERNGRGVDAALETDAQYHPRAVGTALHRRAQRTGRDRLGAAFCHGHPPLLSGGRRRFDHSPEPRRLERTLRAGGEETARNVPRHAAIANARHRPAFRGDKAAGNQAGRRFVPPTGGGGQRAAVACAARPFAR